MRKLKRIVLWTSAALAALLIMATVVGVLVVRSDRFYQYIRQRIVEQIERATGGRVELASYSLDWHNLTAQIQGLVIHGKESPAEPPLLTVGSATLGMRIISVLEKKIDLSSLRIERPQAYFVVYEDGSTNFPGPPARSDKLWTEELLNLKIGSYEIVDGVMEYDGQRIPLHLKGEHLRARMSYEAQTPSYRGDLSTDSVLVTAEGYGPIPGSLSATFAIEKSRFLLPRVRVATKESSADLSGSLDDPRAPHGTFAMQANIAVREVVRIFRLPVEPAGNASFDGQVTVSFADPYASTLRGKVIARGLGYTQDRLRIRDADVRGDLQFDRDRLTLRQMTATAFGANIAGQANLEHGRQFHMEGTIDSLDMRRAAAILTDRKVPWGGVMAGTFSADTTVGRPDTMARANLSITPLGDGTAPVNGQLDVAYDQASGTVALGSSSFATLATRVDVSGTLGKMLQVRLRSTDLDDLLPALALVEDNPPSEIPLKLRNGSATAEGAVTGSLDDPRFTGQVTVANGMIQGHGFDRFTGEIDATRQEINGTRLAVSRGAMTASGAASLKARQGSFDDPSVAAQLDLRNVPLGDLAREAGGTVEIMGTGSANVHVAGTFQRPEAELTLDIQKPAAFGEQADRVRADARYRPGEIDIANGIANDGTSEVRFSGNYRHPENDLKSGQVSFDVSTQNLTASRIQHVARLSPAVDGRLTGRLSGTARVTNGRFELTGATVDVTGKGITVDEDPIGDLTLMAETSGTEMSLRANGNIRDSMVEATGKWRLEGDAPGEATVKFSRMSIESVQDLVMLGRKEDRPAAPPAEGFIQGNATVTLPLQKPEAFHAKLTLDTVQLNPRPNQVLRMGVQQQDLIFKNNQPLVVDVTRDRAQVSPAQFTGRNTNVSVEGGIPFRGAAGADLSVRGNIDLVILQLINADLAAQGVANLQVSIRGNLQSPNVNGRLQFSKASLSYNDLPYVVENAEGSIAFDRNRATIEKLTAEANGGTIAFTGSLDFGAALESGTALVYRLQAEVRRVRLRLPQDLSTTVDASLRLSGASDASTLSGSVTLDRASLTLRSDLFQLLAQSSQPTPVPTVPNQYLQGMRFDVRIESASSFQVETSLTRDVEAEVDLRLRGTAARPVLQGTISINQGEVQFSGARYTINRGDIRFVNPVKIEPTFDMDLETKARGVTVDVSFTGTPSNVKLNWSSDPPLQQSEIIALLATGRDPNAPLNQTAPGVIGGGGTDFAAAGTGLVGQAISSQLNSRFTRFFGATRVKIDPTLIGVDNLPQARLTWEQQVSKDVTLTYITNLNRTQEQLIQIQWDLNKSWSAIAVRDPNGVFGIDFQFRKRVR
ncbi:MAG TPA: translocation/assembly module TamB domain-containing protein [Bryobacteraceae bacterium]|nr:translocation/assembly module TamB domain-containing protein [Bryobacteraceae bacterium]